MIDISFVRDNPDLVSERSAQKGIKVDIPKLIKLDDKRRELLSELDEIRHERNQIAHDAAGKKPLAEL
ncbi:MAG: serine--tRNA ligase, partial [Candidatus Saccharimonadales bacterium]